MMAMSSIGFSSSRANSKEPLDSIEAAGFGAAYAGLRFVLVLQYLRALSVVVDARLKQFRLDTRSHLQFLLRKFDPFFAH